jgi:hypothetical protein
MLVRKTYEAAINLPSQSRITAPAAPSCSSRHSFKNRIGDQTGEAFGSGFYRSNHWFTGSMFGFLRSKSIYILLINAAIDNLCMQRIFHICYFRLT